MARFTCCSHGPVGCRAVKQGVLYISYDGMLEPLGQSQVLAYLERLAADRPIHLISFEKARDWDDARQRQAVRRRITQAGIRWHPLRYHKRPTAPATAFDIATGSALAIRLTLRHRLQIVHARSYVAGVMALAAKRMTGAKFLFDMRGFWADERVDGGLWPADGKLYRAAKAVERRLLRAADHVVTLTHASVAEIRSFPYLAPRMPPISVIPTCANLDRFRIFGPPQRDPFVLGYVGAVGTWYLLDEMLRCFLIVREGEPSARLLMVNRNEQQMIRERAAAHGIGMDEIELVSANHADVPREIARMSAGMALYKPGYSRLACAPTKLAEYLGCGVPCLGNTGVGDVGGILESKRVGVALPDFSDREITDGLRRLIALACDSAIQQRCRETAQAMFSLEGAVESYASIYDQLAPGEA
jgi:glycosyltransferase involved in cell wall biosynthesis